MIIKVTSDIAAPPPYQTLHLKYLFCIASILNLLLNSIIEYARIIIGYITAKKVTA